MSLKWSHAVMYVHDLDMMLDYYTRVLGFRVTDRGPVGGEGSPEIIFMSQDPAEHHQMAFLPVRRDEAPSNTVNHFAFRLDTMDELRTLGKTVIDDERTTNVNPLTHGNTWSIYFSDPEGNGIEIFCETPWHVAQPQGKSWDMTLSDEDLQQSTKAKFEGKPGFVPLESFYEQHAKTLKED